MNAANIDATKKSDLYLLVTAMNRVDTKAEMLANIYGLGLMRASQVIFRLSMWFVLKVKGLRGLCNFFLNLYQRNPDIIEQMLAQTFHHIVQGHDQESPRSAGGWSQREIDLLIVGYPRIRMYIDQIREEPVV